MNKQWQLKFYADVGKEIKKQRKILGYSRYNLAQRAGIQVNTINRIEEGYGFQFFHASWMLTILEIDVTDLVQTNKMHNVYIEDIEGDINGQEEIDSLI